MAGKGVSWLRQKGSRNESRVTFVELFFDLVFVFSISQLSHALADHFTLAGAFETGLIGLAVWWVWVFTAWVTNWLDPDRMPVRAMLFALMLAGLVLSASIPQAFADKGLSFASAYVFMQVGRTLFTVYALKNVSPANFRNFLRIATWLAVAGVFWIAGGWQEGELRVALWLVALGTEYIAPAAGFFVPGLGRSNAADWDVSGAHLAERCALFIIICLGEAILEAGEIFAGLPPNAINLTVFVSVFLGCVAMWWIYFQFGHDRVSHLIEHAEKPGSLARRIFTYAHIAILAGIILVIVANKLAFSHPYELADRSAAAAILGGPLVFLAGSVWFKAATSNRPPLSHLFGGALLLLAMPFAGAFEVYELAIFATGVLVIVGAWEFASLTRPIAKAHRPDGR